MVTPLSSIVTVAVPRTAASLHEATARAWRDAVPGVLSLATPPAGRAAASDAHACSVDVSHGGRRLLARWSTASAPALSIDRHASRSPLASDAIRVHLRGTIAAAGAKAGAVHFGTHLAARIDADDALARECVARLFDGSWHGGDASSLFADALLRTLALHVFTRYATRVAEPERRDDRLADALVGRLRRFIDARLDQRLSRTELARLAGYDARAFSLAFRNTFGMTPMQYVIERRLERACTLIANTRRDLADIAISTGFSSQSHLTSTLKKRRGITPLRLRRRTARGTPA